MAFSSVRFLWKVLEELADGFFLFLVEEVVIVHNVLQFLQVAEEFVGIYKVLSTSSKSLMSSSPQK